MSSVPSWWPGPELAGDQRAEWIARMKQALGPLRIPYAPYPPNPGRQEAYLRLNALEAFYGGAAGGGKSVALLMGALRYVDVPGYAALLVRRTYPDLRLPGALMDMASEWFLGSDATWHAGDRTWTFPSTASITFGYLATENDKYRYRSAAFQYIAFDELTAFTLSQYTYLFSRLRRPDASARVTASQGGVHLGMVPLRMRSASNPGGPGHEWVKTRFVDPRTREAGRVYMPATLDDNPMLDKEAYTQALAQLQPTEYERLLHGDWDVTEQGDIDRAWFHLVEAAPPHVKMVRAWDFAATVVSERNPDPDYTTGTLYHLQPGGRFTVADVIRGRWDPGALEKVVQQTAQLDTRAVPIHLEVEPGSAGKIVYDHYARTVLRGYAVSGERVSGDKWTRARPAIAAARNGLVDVVRGSWTAGWLDRIGRMAPGSSVHDDELDSWGAAHVILAGMPAGPPKLTSAAEVRIPVAGDGRSYL